MRSQFQFYSTQKLEPVKTKSKTDDDVTSVSISQIEDNHKLAAKEVSFKWP